MTFARHKFELGQTQDDGHPLIEHLEAIERATGEVHPIVANAPALSEGLVTLWQTFNELHSCRGSTGWGAARITYMDVDAFQRVTGTVLAPWQIDCIRRTDNLWLGEFAPKPKADK